MPPTTNVRGGEDNGQWSQMKVKNEVGLATDSLPLGQLYQVMIRWMMQQISSIILRIMNYDSRLILQHASKEIEDASRAPWSRDVERSLFKMY